MAIGEYPGNMCYDPDRGSWRPYWLDTLSEEVCHLQSAAAGLWAYFTEAPPGPPTGSLAPTAPQTRSQMTVPGEWTPAQSTPNYRTIKFPDPKPEISWGPLLVIGALGYAVFLGLKNRAGG